MKVLGIVDSFKGTLSSLEIGKILKEELAKKKIEVDYITISDGGEGFLDTIEYLFGLDRVYINTLDPLNREIETYYLYCKKSNTAYIELAKASGISLLKPEEYNPFITNTFGLGKVILDAIQNGIKNIILGIGGSSTNDGGSGLLEALGGEFYDNENNLVKNISNSKLNSLKSIKLDKFKNITKDINFLVVSDVSNPLLGKFGATSTFAMQKGAKFADLSILEVNMANYSNLIEKTNKRKFQDMPGSGAAGGVGFAMLAMFDAKIVSGIDYILDLISFSKIKINYDYIITGEGKIDKTSLFGKVVFKIAEKANPVKVILITAILDLTLEELKAKGIYEVYEIVGKLANQEESLKQPTKYLRQLVNLIDFK